MEGSEEWVPIRIEISTIEAFAKPKQSSAEAQQQHMMRAMMSAVQAKSAGTATLLAVLWPCAGHIYAGEIAGGVIGMMLALIVLVAGGWPFAALIWLVGIVDAGNAARRHNDKLHG